MPPSPSFTRRAFLAALSGVTAAAMLGGVNSSAVAQQAKVPFTAAQCLTALKVIDGIREEYPHRLSRDFLQSLQKFAASGCDLTTPITRVDGFADDQAYGRIRLHLIAIRSPTSPAALRQ
jgi:hypothetical protein